MPGLTGTDPREVFQTFREHVAKLLNQTVTDARLSLAVTRTDARISFRQAGEDIAATLFGSQLHLYVGQVLTAEQQADRTWRLRTLRYAYRIQRGPDADDPCFFRFEYISRLVKPLAHPRHHLHIPLVLPLPSRLVNLEDIHIPTGWVTIEEIIRFLITELNVTPRDAAWSTLLLESEEIFKEWTGRRI